MSIAAMTSTGLEVPAEADLPQRVARGEPRAFELMVSLYQSRVTRLAHRLMGWNGDVDDVVQDVFLAALRKAGSYRGDASVWTWLTSITLNRCRTVYRRRQMQSRVSRLLGRSGEAARADRSALGDEVAQEVRSAVAALPARDRQVTVLFYLEHRTIAQMSQALGDSPNAIEVRLHRARIKLRKSLEAFMKD